MDRERHEQTPAPVHGLNIAAVAGGVASLLWLSSVATLSLFDWSVMGLLSLAVAAMAWFRPTIYRNALWAKMAADLALFWAWAGPAPLADAGAVLAGLAGVYVVLPRLLMDKGGDPRPWAATQAAAAVALFVISYYRVALPPAVAATGFWGFGALFLAVLSALHAHKARLKDGDSIFGAQVVATYALAATAFLSIGMAIELPSAYLPLAFAAQVAATLWVGRRLDITALDRIATVLTYVFMALNGKQIILFFGLAISSLAAQTPDADFARSAALAAPLIKLGLPALFFALAVRIYRGDGHASRRIAHTLFGTALGLALAFAYYMIRYAFHASYAVFDVPAGFVERGLVTLTLGAAGVAIMLYAEATGVRFAEVWGRWLVRIALARIAWFDLVLHNPGLDASQSVGALPLVNGVTLTYGAGLVLTAGTMAGLFGRCEGGFARGLCKLLGFAFLLALTSLNVRQYFHGGILAGSATGNAEFYAYSIVWLLTGLGLLAFGIARDNKGMRAASLVFMLLTVAKVFLFDAGALEGLYRVFSFLGLGVSLIGLSYFYTRFVFRAAEGEKHSHGPWWF